MPFSTIVGSTITSPTRQNYDVTITGSTTVALAYSTAGITDKVGLQVVIYNDSTGTITLTAGTQFDNYTSFPPYATSTQLQIPAKESVTLQTTIIGQDYTIVAISAMVNLDAGGPGQLLYQSAAGNTTFLAAGTQDYVLVSNGINQPPRWSQLIAGNLAGGVAGSLDYQSAANTTSKSAAGTAFTGGTGGIASMNGTTACGWSNLVLQNGINPTYSGGTWTLDNPRAYAFNTSSIGGSSGNLYSFFTANNVQQLGGTIYTIYNDSSSNYVLTIQNIQNPNAWSNSLITSFAAGANQLTIYPYESITLQYYNSTYVTIVSATQSLGLSAIYTIAAPSTAVPGSYYPAIGSIVFDNQGWNSVGDTTYNVGQTGLYRFTFYYNQANAFNTTPVARAYKNQTVTTYLLTLARGYGDVVSNGTYFMTFEVQMNAGDYMVFLVNSRGSGNFFSGLVTITLLN